VWVRFDAEDCEIEDSDAEEEVNGNDDESEEEGSSDEDDDLDDTVGLGAVYSENLDELSDEGDYEAGEEEEDEDGIEEEEEEDAAEDDAQSPDGNVTCVVNIVVIICLVFTVSRGKKRKLEDGEGN
jgi:hypothetical protein